MVVNFCTRVVSHLRGFDPRPMLAWRLRLQEVWSEMFKGGLLASVEFIVFTIHAQNFILLNDMPLEVSGLSG